MPRKPREFYKGGYWHIVNRGLEKIFRDKKDYNFYLFIIKDNLKKYPVNIHAYNLLSNHIHSLIEQSNDEISPTKFLGITYKGLSDYINRKYSRMGHLFQDRCKARHVNDNDYLLSVSFYINLNKVLETLENSNKKFVSKMELDKLLQEAEKDPYSSYPVYLGLKEDGITQPEFILSLLSDDIEEARQKYRKLAREFITSGHFLKTRDIIFEEVSMVPGTCQAPNGK